MSLYCRWYHLTAFWYASSACLRFSARFFSSAVDMTPSDREQQNQKVGHRVWTETGQG